MAEHSAERDRRSKVPKAKVDPTPVRQEVRSGAEGDPSMQGRATRPQERSAKSYGPSPEQQEDSPTQEGAAFKRARQGVRTWVHETFPGHEYAVAGGFAGFLVALLFFAIGFWRTLLVVLLVVVGVAFGQVLDGDPKIIEALRGIFRGDDGR